MATKKTAKKRHALPVNLKSSRALEEKLTRKKAAKRAPFMSEENLAAKRREARKAAKPSSVLVRIRVGPMEESAGMPRATYEKLQRLCFGIGEDTMCGLLELGIETAEARDRRGPPPMARDIKRHRAVLLRLCELLLPSDRTYSEKEAEETKAIELLRQAHRELLL